MINAHRDWLGELHTALAIGTVLGVLAGVSEIGAAVFADTVDMTIQTAGADQVNGLPAGVELAWAGDVEVTVLDPTWAERLVSLAQGAPAYLLGLWIIAMLWRIVRVARRTDPFSPELARRLRRVGTATVVLGLVAEAAQWAIVLAATTLVHDEVWAFSLGLDLWWLLLGFGLLAVAEVLRRGSGLRAELDEVV